VVALPAVEAGALAHAPAAKRSVGARVGAKEPLISGLALTLAGDVVASAVA